MKTNRLSIERSHPDGGRYALHQEGRYWQLTFEGRQSTFKHELGALFVSYLLREPPRETIHGVALALNAKQGSDRRLAS